jgi:hypothetical protein
MGTKLSCCWKDSSKVIELTPPSEHDWSNFHKQAHYDDEYDKSYSSLMSASNERSQLLSQHEKEKMFASASDFRKNRVNTSSSQESTEGWNIGVNDYLTVAYERLMG